MKIYTSVKSIPELSDLQDAWRDHSWSHYSFNALFHWKTLLAFVLCSPIILGASVMSINLAERFPNMNMLYFVLPVSLFSFLVVFFIMFQVVARIVRQHIAKDRAELEKEQ